MSEQSIILAQMQELVMNILKNGSASEEEGQKLDRLEALMLEQKCYQEIDHETYEYQGEEIAGLFISDHYMDAIEKMCLCNITPEDFFGFVEYHYDEDEDESIEIFTDAFKVDVNKAYEAKCLSK